MKRNVKVIHVATTDSDGGAARAAYRIHKAQVKYGINSHMRVLYSGTKDERVTAGAASRSLIRRLAQKLHHRWIEYTHRDWHTDNPILHTFGHVSAGLVHELNASDADVLNLHWISNILSIADIGRLQKPIIWRLADMWAFCGGEHYAPDRPDARFRHGYYAHNRPSGERGPDLNRRTWEFKRRAWARQSFTLVCTTRWMADCARQSVLFAHTPIHIIPNTLDTKDTWRPIPRNIARAALSLPQDKKLILMGAAGGLSYYKGSDLLRNSVARTVALQSTAIELLIFGQDRPSGADKWPCPVHWVGTVRDDRLLVLLYSAADVMVVPSRQEAFGQTASEAQACGTPVAAFKVGGLTDIVTHRETGWLAKPFDTDDLAEGISWILSDDQRYAVLSAAARKQAVERFAERVIAAEYSSLYDNLLSHP